LIYQLNVLHCSKKHTKIKEIGGNVDSRVGLVPGREVQVGFGFDGAEGTLDE
jgi:hypothetical protein